MRFPKVPLLLAGALACVLALTFVLRDAPDAPGARRGGGLELDADSIPATVDDLVALRTHADPERRVAAASSEAVQKADWLVQVVSRVTGEALPGVEVVVTEFPSPTEPPHLVSAATDARGEARFPDGAWTVVDVRGPGLVPARRFPEPGERQLVVAVLRAAPFELRVVDSITGRALEGASVTVRQTGKDVARERRLETDPLGRVRFAWVAAAQPVKLVCRMEGYATGFQEHVVEATGERTVELDELGVVEGTVRWPDGTPAAGAEVELVSASRVSFEPLHRVRTDDEGAFELRHVPLQSWCHVRVESEGGAVALTGESFVIAQPGRRLRQDLGLEASRGSLEVRVVDERGEPRSGVTVEVEPSAALEGPWYPGRETVALSRAVDETGVARFEDLAASSYRIQARSRGAGVWEGECEVRDGEPTTRTVVVPLGESLRVQLLDPGGRPLAGAEVQYRQGGAGDGDELTCRGRTDAQGRYEADGLRAVHGTLRALGSPRDGMTRRWVCGSWGAVEPGLEEQVFQLPAASRLRGRFSPVTGAGVGFVSLRAVQGPELAEFREPLAVEADGSFELELVAGGGPVCVVLERPWGGFECDLFRSLELAPGETRDLGTLDGGGGLRVTGTVRSALGRPLRRAEVLVSAAGVAAVPAWTDDQGTFQFERLFRGPVSLRVSGNRHVPQLLQLDDAAELDGQAFVLQPMARLHGALRGARADAGGRPMLAAEGPDGSTTLAPRELRDPEAFEAWLPAGEHRIWYRAFGDTGWTRGPLVELAAGEELELNLELR